VGTRHHWLGLRLMDAQGKRDLLGAYVELVRPGSSPLVRRVATDGGYGSAKDPRVLFGLGQKSSSKKGKALMTVRVRWPDGGLEAFSLPGVDAYYVLKKGTGRPYAGPSLVRPGKEGS
jgi:hypothetical protein